MTVIFLSPPLSKFQFVFWLCAVFVLGAFVRHSGSSRCQLALRNCVPLRWIQVSHSRPSSCPSTHTKRHPRSKNLTTDSLSSFLASSLPALLSALVSSFATEFARGSPSDALFHSAATRPLASTASLLNTARQELRSRFLYRADWPRRPSTPSTYLGELVCHRRNHNSRISGTDSF